MPIGKTLGVRKGLYKAKYIPVTVLSRSTLGHFRDCALNHNKQALLGLYQLNYEIALKKNSLPVGNLLSKWMHN